MARELVSDTLTPDNINDARFVHEAIDPVDTLRRIGKEWLAIRQKCECKSNEACSVCEIDYLLDEAFRVGECRDTREYPDPKLDEHWQQFLNAGKGR